MRTRAGRWTTIGAMALAALAAACRDRAAEESPDGAPPKGPPAAGQVQLRLEVPGELPWNQDDTLVVTVSNGTPAPLAGATVHLFVQSPVTVLADSAAGARAVATGEGTRVEIELATIEPGREGELRQAVRIPPAPAAPAAAPRDTAAPAPRFLVRAWVTRPGGAQLALAQDTLRVRRGSEVVQGGCATARDVAVSRYGIGPVRLGMTPAALRAACPDARDTTWRGQEGATERGQTVSLGGTPVVAVLDGDRVARIVVDTAGVRTAAGVGVGSTLAELRTRYGRGCSGLGEGRVAVWFPNAPGVSFALDTADTKGLAPDLPADSLPPTARVSGFWVRQGTDDCPARQ